MHVTPSIQANEAGFRDKDSTREVRSTRRIGPFGTASLLMLAVLLPLLVSLWILYAQGFTVPYQDDYNAILRFSLEYLHSANRFSTFVAAQHNEYKLIFEHAVVVLDLEITHHLNFPLMTCIGTLFMPLIGYVLWRMNLTSADGLEARLKAFLPVSLLFFSLAYWENMDWTMTTLQNLPVVFFSLLAMHLLAGLPAEENGVKRFFFACLCGALASLSSANGFLLAPIGFFVLVQRKTFARAAAWGLTFVVPLCLYLYRYQRFPQQQVGNHPMLKRAAFFVGFYGGLIPWVKVAFVTGLVVLGVLVLVYQKGFAKARPDIACFVVWMTMTNALAGWVRGPVSFYIGSRYSIYSVLFVIVCYVGVDWMIAQGLWKVDRRRAYICAVVLTGLYWLRSEVRADHALTVRHDMVVRGIELYRADPVHQSPMIDPKVDEAFPTERAEEQRILTESIHAGIYTLPEAGGR